MGKVVSKIGGFVIGAIEIGVGIFLLSTGNPMGIGLIISGAGMIITQAIVDLTMPHTKMPARDASEMQIQLGEQPRSALFGETYTAGSLVDAFDYGGTYGTDWEVLIIRLADHKCAGLTSFFVNDKSVNFVANGAVAGYNGQLEVYFRSDTTNQALPAIVTANGPGWTAADIGESGCDVVVAYKADAPDADNPVWPGGRPRFGWVVKGKLCYDPRLDDTVGGSGAHRWEDPATWEWSDNPAVCRYNWARGIYANDAVTDPSALLVGRGLSAAEAPPANIFAAANLCDELDGDGNKLFRVSGPVYADQKFIDVEDMFAKATGGSVVTTEGSVELEPGAAKSVVASFTDDDLLVGSKVIWNEGILSESSGEWVNTVVPQYVEPAQQWQSHDAPVVRDLGEILADGEPREASLALRLVRYVAQAQRVAEIYRRLGRKWGRATVTLGPRFCELEDGDWVNWTSARRFGGATKTFRAEAYAIDEKWRNTLTLREISADCFSAGVFAEDLSQAVSTAEPPATSVPGVDVWTLTSETVTSAGVSTPALVIAGAVSDDSSVGAVRFEYWKDDGIIDPSVDADAPDWIQANIALPSVTRQEITSIQGGAAYWGAVTYIVDGIPGGRRVLGPVTAGNMDVSGQVQPLIDAAVGKLAWKEPVRAKTTAALAANTYANGVSGVGATLTGNANGALAAQDGVTLAAGERLLVDQEAAGSHNGIYVVTQAGDGTHPYILTRADDADEADELVNAAVKVSEGTAHADEEWQCTTNAAITVGTTALAFVQAGGSAAIAIKDEGSTLTSAPVSINFTGSGVSATDDGAGNVTVAVSGAPGGGFRGALVALTANAASANYTGAGQAVSFGSGTEIYDTDSIHDETTNPSRLTVPSGVTKVRLSGQIAITGGTSGNALLPFLSKNGTGGGFAGRPGQWTATSTSSGTVQFNSPALPVAAGDYFELIMADQSDTSIVLTANDTWFAMEIVE